VHQAAEKVGSMIGDRNLVGLVNNAGIVVSGPLLYLRPSEYRRQLEVNMVLTAPSNPVLKECLTCCG
jgi:short-subunit dehydrogenase